MLHRQYWIYSTVELKGSHIRITSRIIT